MSDTTELMNENMELLRTIEAGQRGNAALDWAVAEIERLRAEVSRLKKLAFP